MDEDGLEVAHGHYYEELGIATSFSSWYGYGNNFPAATIFTGGDFNFDLGRRKVRFAGTYVFGAC